MDSSRAALQFLKDWLDWLPAPIVAVLIIAVAVLFALAVHRYVHKGVCHLLERRYPTLYSIATQMYGITRLAVLVLAVVVALPVAPIDHALAELLARLLLMAVIGVIGWAVITGLHIGANIYLRRFRLDADNNLLARKHTTQVRVLMRTTDVMLVLLTAGAALMTFEPVRQYGVSLFASAGVAGIVAGLAARPLLTNLIAGVQLAMTQPIRLEDAVVVENEWGNIEEINSTYVVVRLWDWRRMVVPLKYFIETPFQNWTRESASLIGTAFIYVDYRAPVGAVREKLTDIVKHSKLWDGRVVNLQVTDVRERTIELRCLASAGTAGQAFDLRCEIREKLIAFLQEEYPEALPRQRTEVEIDEGLVPRLAATNGNYRVPTDAREPVQARRG